MSEMAALAAQTPDLAPFTTIKARTQTAGRGRQGRSWLDAGGGALLFTTVVYIPSAHLTWTGALAGLSLVGALSDLDVEACLKWPNDVLADGKKLAGILCEHLRVTPRGHAVAVGVGINVAGVPSDVADIATCVCQHLPESSAPVREQVGGADGLPNCPVPNRPVPDLEDQILGSFLEKLRQLLDSGQREPDPRPHWRTAYLEQLGGLGKPARIHLPDGSQKAVVAVDVDENAALVAQRAVAQGSLGEEIIITAGDFVPLTEPPT